MKGASLIAPFGLRMPEDLKGKIAERAKSNGRSMNAEIVQILQDAIDLEISEQEALASFDSRVTQLIEEATKKAMAQAGLELSLKIEEIAKKKPS